MILSVFLVMMLLFVLLLLFIIASAFAGFLLTRVPFVPSSSKDIEFVATELKIQPEAVFFDLGSGDGKVCFLVHRLTGAKCVGYELTWWTHLLAKIKRKMRGNKGSVEFKNQNFFKHDWKAADYIYAYLYPPLMRRVEEKFLADCKPGSVAIVRDFRFPNLKPEIIYMRPGRHEIYIYRK